MTRRGLALAIAGMALAGAAGWVGVRPHGPARAAPPAQADSPGVAVTEGVARAQDVPVYVTGLGTVQPINTVSVKTRVDGQVQQVFFKEGQEVKAGDPLFLIDPRPFQAAVDQAKATETKDEAQLAGAQKDLERYGKLVGTGFQTKQSFEDQQATVAADQAAVTADKAAVEAAQLNLTYALIHAPITGRTGALLVTQGNEVQASAATPLVTVTQMQPIYVGFTVPQTALDEIRQNQAKAPLDVLAYSQDGKTRLAEGKLSFIDNHVDNTTGTVMLKATFANADERLWPGAFVSARLIVSIRHNAVTVPAQTVMAGPNDNYVYVVKPDGTVARQTVQVAARQDGIAVISQGLEPGQTVVTDGQYRLTNGTRVKPAGPAPAQPVATATQAS